MTLILCQRGEIYPYGGVLLAVDVDGRPVTARRLAKLGLRLVQDGDNEKTFVFPVEQFAQVAKIVKPRRHRQVSDAEKRRLADLARRHGFQKSDLHRPERSQRRRSSERVPTRLGVRPATPADQRSRLHSRRNSHFSGASVSGFPPRLAYTRRRHRPRARCERTPGFPQAPAVFRICLYAGRPRRSRIDPHTSLSRFAVRGGRDAPEPVHVRLPLRIAARR
jgi:hypothetical protein